MNDLCDECGAPAHPDARGEFVCSNCSLVLNNTIIDASPGPVYDAPRPEPSSFINTGAPTTRITNERYDARGSVINETARERMRNLTWLDNHSSRPRDRSIRRLHNMVVDVGLKLGLPQMLRDRAFYLVKQAYSHGVLRGQEFTLLVGVCLMLAAKEAKYHLPTKVLLSRLIISRQNPNRQLNRAYRTVKKALAMQIDTVSPSALLPAVSVKMKLDRDMLSAIHNLLARMEDDNYHRPEVDLGAAIYLSSLKLGRGLSQVAIATACGTTDVSIRSRLESPNLQILRKRGDER